MKNYYGVIILLISLHCFSCSTGQKNQEVQENKELPTEESAAEEDAEIYCCSNHDPAHCGTAEEVEELASSGCEGF